MVKPDTVIAWHRQGFRWFWTWRVRRGQPGRPSISKEIRKLIRKMSRDNPIWGAPRIHGELLQLGIDSGETSVSKYMVRRRNPPSQTWRTFLENRLKSTVSMVHKTLSCQVEPQKPYLGFDLRFHASYRATVPVEALAAGGHLQEVVRVRPKPDGKPVLLVRRIEIPAFAGRFKGMGSVDGGFDIGPGGYEIDWMMREGSGRVCSHWNLDVEVGSRGRKLPLTIRENMVTTSLTSLLPMSLRVSFEPAKPCV